MKLEPRAFNHLTQAESKFNRFEEKFRLFLTQLMFFTDSACPVKGVTFEVAQDSRAVTVKYRTVTLTLRMLLQLSTQNTPLARVDCVLHNPADVQSVVSIGSFTFNPQGHTNFDPDPDGDAIDLEGKALEIVVHFLTLALRQGAA